LFGRYPDSAKRFARCNVLARTKYEERLHARDYYQRGRRIYYKDWGKGQPVVFSHGWPLSADAWEDQVIFLAGRGYRCIAHDPRGHGRSSQPSDGNGMNTYADDLAALVEALDLKDARHVGHSTGGGEVARYIGRHGTKRVAKAVLISAVPPFLVKPGGLAIAKFDGLGAQILADRAQLWKEFSAPFYGESARRKCFARTARLPFGSRRCSGGIRRSTSA
jgi:non-heme chloroperoxidase